MTPAFALVAITTYAGVYVGQPLYCDTWDTDLTYSADTVKWVAMPDAFWDAGGQCWDDVVLMIDGKVYVRKALDRVQHGDWYVTQASGVLLPLGADWPAFDAPFEGLSTTGYVDNGSAREREWAEREGHYGPH